MEADHEAAAALQRNSPSFPWKMALLSLPFECMELATSYIQGGTRINLSLFGQLVHRTMGNYLLGSAAYEALSGSSALALFCSAPAVRWAFFAANVWGLVGSAWRLLAAVHAWEYLLGALGDMTGAQGPLGPIPEGHFLERALQCPVVNPNADPIVEQIVRPIELLTIDPQNFAINQRRCRQCCYSF